MDKIIKKQHYVPRFYLANFCEKENIINVLDKNKLSVFKSNIKNIACQKYFYDINNKKCSEKQGIEKLLGNIENESSLTIKHILKKLESNKIFIYEFTDNERYSLAFFFCLQFVRTKKFRYKIANIYHDVISNIAKLKGLNNIKIKMKIDSFSQIYIRPLAKIDKITEYLMQQNFFLIINCTQIPFYCSDNPAILDNEFCKNKIRNNGFLSPNMNFYLPLSSKICLFIVPKKMGLYKDKKDNIFFTSDEQHILYINDLQIKNSHSQIYSCTNKFFDADIDFIKNKKC